MSDPVPINNAPASMPAAPKPSKPSGPPPSPAPKQGFGRNQQISVASLFALLLGMIALGLGIFPITNTYSLIPAGLALLLTARATLYAFAGTIHARVLPVVALVISMLIAGFCWEWPYYGDDILDRVMAWAHPPEKEPEPAPEEPAVVPDAERKAAQEIQDAIKQQMEQEKKDAAGKPPRPTE